MQDLPDVFVPHAYKEQVKVGYNLRRKVVLHLVWALTPLLLWWQPTLFGIFTAHMDAAGFLRHLAQLWIALAAGALLFRTFQLFFVRDVMTGLVWFTKILTDPFHDIKLYHKSPIYLLRGELIDPAIATERVP